MKPKLKWKEQKKNILDIFNKYPAMISDLLDAAYLAGFETAENHYEEEMLKLKDGKK
jgi:hypothetical protein